MDQKWLEQQKEQLSLALAEQGLRVVVPLPDQERQSFYSQLDTRRLAPYIDHTNLKPDASRRDIRNLCDEAQSFGFHSVCVNPVHVRFASELLKDSSVQVCTVVGFPLGATTTLVKVLEARDALAAGATEIDMVLNIGALAAGDYATVLSDIKAVRDSVPEHVLKVILETCFLTKEQIVRGSILVKMAGADFVKTSTGFGPSGATIEDVAIMRAVVGLEFGVKASGGIRDGQTAQQMIKAGANRLGTSSGPAIVQGLEGKGDY